MSDINNIFKSGQVAPVRPVAEPKAPVAKPVSARVSTSEDSRVLGGITASNNFRGGNKLLLVKGTALLNAVEEFSSAPDPDGGLDGREKLVASATAFLGKGGRVNG